MTDQALEHGARTPYAMAELGETIALGKANKAPAKTLALAIMAGMMIALAGVFYTTVSAGAGVLPYGIAKLIGGISFSVGLMMVVLCGGDLFTSSTLITIPAANGKVGMGKMLKNWGIVYLGNLIGSLLMVAMILYTDQWHGGHGSIGYTALKIANGKMGHSFGQALVLGILCNIMVCIAVWMSYSARTASGKMMAMVLPVAMFIASGFEHSIANMYLMPIGLAIKSVADAGFWMEIGKTAADFSNINFSNMLFMNLIPVTIGNIIGGGILIGLFNWGVFLKKD
ncbi:formate transporter FocA [Sansalvadorimonas sp. 2012CJ34-2]|uniref:Formate transporter FocA n=1 Tax=Parendozoicomonas callyspongiae TaxID=2942213 RepID=A0ABT0PG52_9GAMM|nr:formate transporter FocA [Sansalvadorimonas sp. 2012CJ34-2]MCL6270347.1 formate transporter FocA [Sansalvadorimonas sp. 2012CJ34-2]